MSHYDPSQPPQPPGQHSTARTQTEWQRFPSPPLPQDQPYQPAIQPRPPAKKARGGGLLIPVAAIVVMLALLGFAIALQNHLQPATRQVATTSQHLQKPTPIINKITPLPALVIQAIGKPVVVDSTWTVLVHGARTSLGDPFSRPQAGDVYLVVDVTVKNTSTHFQDMLSGNQCILKDSTGQTYREAITDFATPPDGSIKPGASQRGQLAYEIPATLHTFYYYFQADTSEIDLTEWVLHV